jgi:hypothetical protein
MGTAIEATFAVTSWDEGAFDDGSDDRPKLTRATVTKTYSGAIEGTSTTQWLMAYADDGSAAFVGLERIVGTVDGRDGSMVLQHLGTFSDGAAKGSLDVIPGAGTAALAPARGDGTFLADPAGSVTLDLTFDPLPVT